MFMGPSRAESLQIDSKRMACVRCDTQEPLLCTVFFFVFFFLFSPLLFACRVGEIGLGADVDADSDSVTSEESIAHFHIHTG